MNRRDLDEATISEFVAIIVLSFFTANSGTDDESLFGGYRQTGIRLVATVTSAMSRTTAD
jgi:hypothetical protein